MNKNKMAKIIVIGSSNTDMVIKSARVPKPGETLLGGQFFMNAGGKGANQTVAVARLGGTVKFVSSLGNDVFGKRALENFKKEGIDTKYVSISDDQPSGVALITVSEKGENAIVVAPGANNALETTHIDNAIDAIKASDVVLIQLEIPMPVVAYTVRTAHQLNKKVVLNPAPARNLSEDVLSCVYAITPNEIEAAFLTGIEVTDKNSASDAAKALRRKGVKVAIITMGGHGAYVSCEEFEGMIVSRKVEAVDTTAAGDTFNGALAVAMAEGKTIKEAVTFANYAASLSVTKYGAQSSIPNLAEVLSLELLT